MRLTPGKNARECDGHIAVVACGVDRSRHGQSNRRAPHAAGRPECMVGFAGRIPARRMAPPGRSPASRRCTAPAGNGFARCRTTPVGTSNRKRYARDSGMPACDHARPGYPRHRAWRRPVSRPETTTLYRLYDSHRVLLYVGISNQPLVRFGQHAADKPWWTEVAHIDLDHFHERSWAEAAERQAITREHPLYNVVHSPHPDGLDWWVIVEHEPEVEALSVEISFNEAHWNDEDYTDLPCGTALWFGYSDPGGHRLGMKHRLRTLAGPDAKTAAPSIVRHPIAYNIAARYLLEQLIEADLHRYGKQCCR